MRAPLIFLEKRRGNPFVYEGKIYRSELHFLVNRTVIVLYVEHIPGKPAGTPPRELIASGCTPGIAEGQQRYAKSGGHALVKSALLFNDEKTLLGHFALKCFYKAACWSFALLKKEADAWQLSGEAASVFIRKSDAGVSGVDFKSYILMPWLQGCDLHQFFSNADKALSYPIDNRVALLAQIFSQLQQIGLSGKVFSDFKLENIMYDEKQQKISFVDCRLSNNGESIRFLTKSYLEPQRCQEFERLGSLAYTWEDQMYAFGRMALLILGVKAASSDSALKKVFVSVLQTVFCNPDKSIRPKPSTDTLIEIIRKNTSAGSGIVYSCNPYRLQAPWMFSLKPSKVVSEQEMPLTSSVVA